MGNGGGGVEEEKDEGVEEEEEVAVGGAAAPRPDSFTFFMTQVHLGCVPTAICSSL